MIEEQAKVVALEADRITIRATRMSACGVCQAAEACGTRKLGQLFKSPDVEMSIANPQALSVEIGQQVLVGLHEQAFFRAALILYLTPLAAMLFSVLLMAMFTSIEGWLILASLIGLGLGFVLGRIFSRYFLSDMTYQPVLLKVLS